MRPLTISLALLLASCAAPPTGLLDPTPVHLDATYRRVLIVGVGLDEPSRRNIEAAFAADLPGSAAAYTMIPGTPTVAGINAAVARLGADAILAIRLLPVSQHSDASPGYVYGLPASAMPVGFGSFYGAAALTGAAQHDAASLEIDLWAVQSDSLAWSALTPVFTPTDAGAITASAAVATGNALVPPVKH